MRITHLHCAGRSVRLSSVRAYGCMSVEKAWIEASKAGHQGLMLTFFSSCFVIGNRASFPMPRL